MLYYQGNLAEFGINHNVVKSKCQLILFRQYCDMLNIEDIAEYPILNDT
jgi:hypothetical protein